MDIARKLAKFCALKYNLMDQSVKVVGTEGKVGGIFCQLPPFNKNMTGSIITDG